MRHTAEDYRDAFRALLPPIEVLDSGPDSGVGHILAWWAEEFARLDALAAELNESIDPRFPSTYLTDFETLLALPECGDLAPTLQERRAVAHEKLTGKRDLTLAYLESAAAAIGQSVTITQDFIGSPFVFDVEISAYELTTFRAGESEVGELLQSYGDETLVCLLDNLKPAHLNYVLTTP